MGEERARLVFTDPPYNVPIDGHVCGLGAVKHREFAMAAGEMSQREFTAFLETALGELAGACLDGAILYVCMDWRHLLELLTAGDINIHFIDALGTFSPPPMMAGPAGAGPRPNWRLFGAIVETPRGLLTFKATGPDKTMSANREKMRAFLTSLRAQ